jgi:hypothetical protein
MVSLKFPATTLHTTSITRSTKKKENVREFKGQFRKSHVLGLEIGRPQPAPNNHPAHGMEKNIQESLYR